MSVISIIGAPGSGKSFLIKQLGCLNNSPAFFEGEKGIFTKEILKVLNSPKDSKERFEWLTKQYKKNLQRAHEISKLGMDAYVDGDILSFEAWLAAEKGRESIEILKNFIDENQNLRADKVLVLIKTKQALLKTLASRGRKSEQTDFIFKRAIRVQKGMIEVSKKYRHSMIIDRTSIDYTDEKKLKKVNKLIKGIKGLKR